MENINLTPKQRQLVRGLVEKYKSGFSGEFQYLTEEETAREITFPGQYGGLPADEFDLMALKTAGLLKLRQPSNFTIFGTLTPAAKIAVETDFQLFSSDSKFDVSAILHGLSGDKIQALGYASETEFTRMLQQPDLLQAKVDELADQLLEAVKTALSGDDLINYAKAVQYFKEQLVSDDPSMSILNRLTSTLAFLGDIEGSFNYTAMAWTPLYPLLLIAAARFG